VRPVSEENETYKYKLPEPRPRIPLTNLCFAMDSNHETRSIADIMHCHKFIIEVARCFLAFGAPAHRLEAQLTSAAKILDVQAEFLLLPNVVFISFHDAGEGSGLHVIKRLGNISLSQLRATHSTYRRVVNLEATPEQGWRSLVIIQHSHPPYTETIRCSIAFLCGAVITLLAFDGSFLDALIAGSAQCALVFLNFHMMATEPIIARIFE
jgi:uncharacterized membrane protein YjjP (DUF1212 family)